MRLALAALASIVRAGGGAGASGALPLGLPGDQFVPAGIELKQEGRQAMATVLLRLAPRK